MTKNPLFTIVTVVYNGEKYIEDTIKSIISNKTKFDNIEYIIIDGLSKDNTINIIKKYEKDIDYWVSEKDKGIYDAMNKGIKVAKGKYIAFLNADDWYENDIFCTISKYLDTVNISPDFIYGNFNLCTDDKTYLYTYIPDLSGLKKKMTIGHPSMFIKTDIHKKYLFNLDFPVCADYDLTLRLVKDYSNFKYFDEVFTNFRLVGISTQTNVCTELFNIQKRHFNKFVALKNFFLNQLEFNLIKILRIILGKNRFDKMKNLLRRK